MTTTFDEEEGKEDDGFSETRRSSSSVPKAKVNNKRKETLFLRWTRIWDFVEKSSLKSHEMMEEMCFFVSLTPNALSFLSL